jgi:hypothetical protein
MLLRADIYQMFVSDQVVIFVLYTSKGVGQDSSVGIATHYRLDSLGIESEWGRDFQTDPGAHPASYTVGTGPFPGLRWPGYGIDHPLSSCAEVKERAELFLHSPFGPLWPVIG